MTTQTQERVYKEAPPTGTTQLRHTNVAPPIASGRIQVITWGQTDAWSGTGQPSVRRHHEDALERQFRALADQWRRETAGMSNPVQIAMHRDYQAILARGREFLPLILKELATKGGDWYFALRVICRAYGWLPPEIPIEASGNMRRVNEIWLQWGRERGYVV